MSELEKHHKKHHISISLAQNPGKAALEAARLPCSILGLIRSLSTCIFPLLTALLLNSCSEATSNVRPMVMPPATVQVEEVRVEKFKDRSEYIGTMKSRKSVSLLPHVEGHITAIFVNAGDSVKAGARILTIDSRMQVAQQASAEAAAETVQSELASEKKELASLESSLQSKLSNVEFTKAQYKRYESLARQGAVAQSELDQWKNNFAAAQAERDTVLQQIEAQKMTIQKFERSYKQASANLQAQKENLGYYEIKAPFAGIIGDIPVKLGEHLSKTTVLTTLTENHPLEAYIQVPAEKASQMKVGMKIALASSNNDFDYGESKVSFIAPSVDALSQTVLVKSLYPNDKNLLRVDQSVKAKIVWSEKDGIVVPTSAVTQAAGKHFVFLCEEDKEGHSFAHQVEIETNGIEGSSFQVKSGLKPGDRIVTSGIQRLIDGAPIKVKAAQQGGGESGAQKKGLMKKLFRRES